MLQKNKHMATQKAKQPKKSAAIREKLMSVKPSVKKDESYVELVLELARQIPKGRVTTYGAIASALGLSNPRMVGRAMKACSEDSPVPAHRVINSSGRISGEHRLHRSQSLKKEGIKVDNYRVVEFQNLFWDPIKELP